MGFFLAGFVRDQNPVASMEEQFLRDERGHLVRDLMGFPVRAQPNQSSEAPNKEPPMEEEREEEWAGFEDDDIATGALVVDAGLEPDTQKTSNHSVGKHSQSAANKKRPQLGIRGEKKRRKR